MKRIILVFRFREIPKIPIDVIYDATYKYSSNYRLRNYSVEHYVSEKKVIWKKQKKC